MQRVRRAWPRIGVGMHLVLVPPFLLAGVLPVDDATFEHWPSSGAWVMPVGDPYTLGEDDSPPGVFRVTRGVLERNGEERGHDGADLSSRRGGDPVHAAAAGLVVHAGWSRGYGNLVVIAHAEEDGTLLCSVYGHLAPKSIRVHKGDAVYAAEPIARVGMTGRATSPHLHFEVRALDTPDQRWETARVLDPLETVTARLPRLREDTTWAAPYLVWGECAGLIAHVDDPRREMTRGEWWRMLAGAVLRPNDPQPLAPDSLGVMLRRMDLVSGSGPANSTIEWKEVARDLKRLKARRYSLPPSPVSARSRHAECREQIGLDRPASELTALGKLHREKPTTAGACLLLADLAGDEP